MVFRQCDSFGYYHPNRAFQVPCPNRYRFCDLLLHRSTHWSLFCISARSGLRESVGHRAKHLRCSSIDNFGTFIRRDAVPGSSATRNERHSTQKWQGSVTSKQSGETKVENASEDRSRATGPATDTALASFLLFGNLLWSGVYAHIPYV